MGFHWRIGAIVVAAALLLGGCSSGGGGATSDSPTTTTSRGPAPTKPADRSGQAARTVTVFRAKTEGYASFRIPAIVRSKDGTLLAFAEGRVASSADDGNVDLVLKRSTDDGRTWGKLQVVAQDGTDFVGNPSPVVDPETGRISVLATHKAGGDTEVEILTGTSDDVGRVWLTASTDDGASWSAPTDLTDGLKEPNWYWYSVGPGHAIALQHGPHAGRLVATANHSRAPRGQGDHVLLSDDGGRTWRLGARDTPTPGTIAPDESTAAERPDGTIVFSSRNQQAGADWHRLQATSTDGGETYATPFAEQADLVVPAVQGSLLWAGGRSGRLLFSAPADESDRVDVTIRSSTDGGRTWSSGTVVHRGPGAYSDLVDLGAGLIGDLHEAGDESPNERIDFTTLGLTRIR